MPFMYFFQFLQMAQRGAGDSRTPFYFMGLAVVLDMLLNPLLIGGVGPVIGGWGPWIPRIVMPFHFQGMGVAGSATSTLIGQGVSLVLLLITLYRKNSILMLKGRDLRFLAPNPELLGPLIFRGIPMSLQMFIMSSAGMTMQRFVNGFGALTSASYIGAMQVWNYIQMPGMAIGMSVSSMASQNVGAGQWARVERIALIGLVLSVYITGSIAVLIYLLGAVAALHIPADRLADHPGGAAHRSHGAVGVRDLQRHVRPLRRGPLHRRGLAAAGHPLRLDGADPGAVRLFHDPALRYGGDLVELPARHPRLQRPHRTLLPLRRLAEGADDAPWCRAAISRFRTAESRPRSTSSPKK